MSFDVLIELCCLFLLAGLAAPGFGATTTTAAAPSGFGFGSTTTGELDGGAGHMAEGVAVKYVPL